MARRAPDAPFSLPLTGPAPPDSPDPSPASDAAGEAVRGCLPAWFDPGSPPRHDDLSARVVLRADEAEWQPSRHPALEMRVLEHFAGAAPRLSAQLRLAAGADTAALGSGADGELLVQRGELVTANEVWPVGHYVRLPLSGAERVDELALRRAPSCPLDPSPAASLYLATGHIAASDTERRHIDTTGRDSWLPGPVTGTEVLPLHGHGSANVMLIRWSGAIAFRPRLDPLGEEVLVLEGCLHDADGDYPAGSWIRNPVPAWQSWSGEPGTVVYYKNGHFATTPDGSSLPFPTTVATDGGG